MTLYKHYVSLLPADPPPKLFKFPNLPNISVDLGDSVDLTFLALDSHNGEVAIHITEHRRSEIINYTFDNHDLSNFFERSHSYGIFQVEGELFDSQGFLLSIKVVNNESAANTTGIEASMTLHPSSTSGSINVSTYVTLLKENSSDCQCSSDVETTTPTTYSTTNVTPSYVMPTNAPPSQATPSTGTASYGIPPPYNTPSDRGSTVLGTLVIGLVIVIVLQGLTLLLTFRSNKTKLFPHISHPTSNQFYENEGGQGYEHFHTSQGGAVREGTDISGDNFTMKKIEREKFPIPKFDTMKHLPV